MKPKTDETQKSDHHLQKCVLSLYGGATNSSTHHPQKAQSKKFQKKKKREIASRKDIEEAQGVEEEFSGVLKDWVHDEPEDRKEEPRKKNKKSKATKNSQQIALHSMEKNETNKVEKGNIKEDLSESELREQECNSEEMAYGEPPLSIVDSHLPISARTEQHQPQKRRNCGEPSEYLFLRLGAKNRRIERYAVFELVAKALKNTGHDIRKMGESYNPRNQTFIVIKFESVEIAQSLIDQLDGASVDSTEYNSGGQLCTRFATDWEIGKLQEQESRGRQGHSRIQQTPKRYYDHTVDGWDLDWEWKSADLMHKPFDQLPKVRHRPPLPAHFLESDEEEG